jgi:hypothetical protein
MIRRRRKHREDTGIWVVEADASDGVEATEVVFERIV